MRNLPLILFVLVLSVVGASLADEATTADRVVIEPNAILMPLGRIILARRGNEYCAVKLLSNEKGKEAGEWKATYESYYQSDMSGTFRNKTVKYRKDELMDLQPVGIGRLAAKRSKDTIFCGKISLNWSGQGWIYPYTSETDRASITLAPTKWTEIPDVNFLARQLVWYGYDEKRKTIEIPVDKLW